VPSAIILGSKVIDPVEQAVPERLAGLSGPVHGVTMQYGSACLPDRSAHWRP
jgi:hypothetical protein